MLERLLRQSNRNLVWYKGNMADKVSVITIVLCNKVGYLMLSEKRVRKRQSMIRR